MSPAGVNRVCRMWRFSYPQDDAVGGSVPSGTILYSNLDARISAQKPTQVLQEQGLQVPTIYHAMLFEGNVEIMHNDQIEFTAPVTDWFYGKKFRVIGLQRSSNHPYQERNQIKLILRRWESSHSNDLQ
jgi:hypothetical protein